MITFSANIELSFDNKKDAEAFYNAIKNEVSKKGRFSSSLTLKDRFIKINIKDKDRAAFMAVLGTYMRYVQTIEEV